VGTSNFRLKAALMGVLNLYDVIIRAEIPAGAGNFSLYHRCVQTGSGAQPSSYPMGTRGSFLDGEADGV
jgi:hypothetical protein